MEYASISTGQLSARARQEQGEVVEAKGRPPSEESPGARAWKKAQIRHFPGENLLSFIYF